MYVNSWSNNNEYANRSGKHRWLFIIGGRKRIGSTFSPPKTWENSPSSLLPSIIPPLLTPFYSRRQPESTGRLNGGKQPGKGLNLEPLNLRWFSNFRWTAILTVSSNNKAKTRHTFMSCSPSWAVLSSVESLFVPPRLFFVGVGFSSAEWSWKYFIVTFHSTSIIGNTRKKFIRVARL